MKRALTLSVVVMGFVFGCREVVKKPEWVMKGSGAYAGEPSTKICAYGVASIDPNKALQVEQARARARTELALTISTTVQALVKDFMESHKDWFNLQDTAGSEEFFSYVSRQVTDQTLVGSRQMDSWEDPKTGDLYMFYCVDLNNEFYEKYRDAQRNLIRQKHRAIIKERADEALQELDKEVEKQRKREREILQEQGLLKEGE